jgi:hypothetical protein
MFEAGILQSGFWHQFAMTAHSPVGMYPERFSVVKDSEVIGTFANNDINYMDKTGIDHDKFSFGLKKSLFNYMHGICFDYPLQDWFESKIPKTKIPEDFIVNAVQEEENFDMKLLAKIVWIGRNPIVEYFIKSKKGNSREMAKLIFHDKKESFTLQVDKKEGEWLSAILQQISAGNLKIHTLQQVKTDFENTGLENFELFWYSKPINTLRNSGLLVL